MVSSVIVADAIFTFYIGLKRLVLAKVSSVKSDRKMVERNFDAPVTKTSDKIIV